MRAQFEVIEEDCIGCGLCEERAPGNIQIPPGEISARVVKQPVTDAETEACQQAVDFCPMGGLRAADPDVGIACFNVDKRRES